jgi:hypothetical protein
VQVGAAEQQLCVLDKIDKRAIGSLFRDTKAQLRTRSREDAHTPVVAIAVKHPPAPDMVSLTPTFDCAAQPTRATPDLVRDFQKASATVQATRTRTEGRHAPGRDAAGNAHERER